jgi:hypothetical protein
MIEDYQEPRVHPEVVETLQDAWGTLCSAATSLRCMAGALEDMKETNAYNHEDLTGDIHNIRRALQTLEVIIRGQGLKGDPIKYRV